ncbi:Efflux ABC transporter, ATP-binding protein [hydrothermal vent metagenome]|uniref:Efflux ABC transporter, ATP-binding protein n=1 Tax=hydrothermal vent metagenome TaxID=652676 RepID=A0A3B1BXB1_9ZZZZ
MPGDTIVQGENVVKKYGGLVAVDHVDFAVKKGECFGFLGPNGAGKTSVMKMIQCFSPLTSGAITVDGMRVGRDNAKIKAALGVAPQDENLDNELTVIQNLEIYASYFDIPRDIAADEARRLLSFFHLEDKIGDYIRELSGGMRRRLVIARALINNPKLLILDEPTTGLDPQARRVIWRKLEGLKKEGVTMILTTHYMEEAMRLCDRVVIMDKGRILAQGAPHELVNKTLGDSVIEFRPDPESTGETKSFLDLRQVKYDTDGDTFYIFNADPESLLDSLEKIDHQFLDNRSATLEDLFLKITGHNL